MQDQVAVPPHDTRPPSISALLRFESMALVGASDSSNFGKGAWRALGEVGFTGRYYPVNSKRDQVHDTQAFPSVRAIPASVDAAVIATASGNVMAAIEDCAAKGVKAVVVLSSNFAEAGDDGRALQARVADYVKQQGIAMIGPNCLGVASIVNRCALFQGRGLGKVRAGNVGLVSQSGGILIETVAYGTGRGVGFSHLFSTGNEAALTFEDALDHLVDDPATDVLAVVIETARNPAKFLAVAERAAVAGKPLIVLKLGVSEKGAKSAMTHTGALTGSSSVWRAALEQRSAVAARDIDELVDLIALFSGAVRRLRARPMERVGVLEISGGATELICDLSEAAGVDLPDLAPAATGALRAALPDYLSIGNPLDLGVVWVDPAMAKMYPAALEAFAGSPDIDIVVSRYIVPSSGPIGDLSLRVAEMTEAQTRHPDRLFVAMTPTSDHFTEEWTDVVHGADVPFLQGLGRGVSALGKLAKYSRALTRRSAVSGLASGAMAMPNVCIPGGKPVLSEIESKDVLRGIGLPVVETVLATTAEEACAAADRIGYPIVAKIVSPQLTHKSDVGGVKLNIPDAETVSATFADFKALVERQPGALFEGVSIQPMAKPGVEVIIGAERDPQVGPVILFGLGGIFVEVLADVTLRVAPLSLDEARAMLGDIRGKAMLLGARGRLPVDLDAIARAIVRIGDLMVRQPDIAAIDCNPAFAYPDGLAIVDARIETVVPANAAQAH